MFGEIGLVLQGSPFSHPPVEGISWSVQFSRSVVFDSLRPHEPQHARPPCQGTFKKRARDTVKTGHSSSQPTAWPWKDHFPPESLRAAVIRAPDQEFSRGSNFDPACVQLLSHA